MGQLINDVKMLREREATCGRAESAAMTELERAEANLNWAIAQGTKTVAKWQKLVEQLQPTLDAARSEHVAVAKLFDAAASALMTVRTLRWEARRAELVAAVQGLWDGAGEDVWLDGQTRSRYGDFDMGRWTISLVNVREDGSRERRFGFEAEVHGPEIRQRWNNGARDVEEYWQPVMVNWGTLGALDIEHAEDQVRLHRLAIQVARFLEEKRDAWYAEDMAD